MSSTREMGEKEQKNSGEEERLEMCPEDMDAPA